MAKTEMNAFDVAAAVAELDLAGARVDKCYQPARDELLVRVRKRADEGGRFDLAFGPGRYAFLTTVKRDNPSNPSQFALILRKHLAGGFVRGLSQHAFDRVVVLDVEKKDARYQFVVELFHDGNAILVREGKIIATLHRQEFAHRTIRPGHDYVFPPPRTDPRTLTSSRFELALRGSDVDVVRTLAVELNLGGVYAEEVVHRAGVDKHAAAESLDKDQVAALYDALTGLVQRVREPDLAPLVVVESPEGDGDEDPVRVDVAPFPLARHEGRVTESYDTFNAALDAYFSKPYEEKGHDARQEKVDEEKGRLDRQLHQQRAALVKFEKQEVEERRKGDTLYAHFQGVQALLKYLANSTRDIGWEATEEKLAEKDFGKVVERLLKNEGAAMLKLPDPDGKVLPIKVDIRRNVQENAEACYERAKKLKDKQAGAREAFKRTQQSLREAEEHEEALLKRLEEERNRAEPTKRFWFDKFRWFVTSHGHVVAGGRDATSNERVVKQHLGDQDRYVHADLHGAPSLVVKANDDGDSPDEESLLEAAVFAVAMSKAWTMGHAAGEAYWVRPTQVSKTPQSGEFLAKGAFIIRGKRNYASVTVRLAVGEVQVKGARKVMCGPESAVAAQSERYLVLLPGDEEKNAFANRVAELFEVPLEEVQQVLPPGNVQVVEAVGVTW